MQKPIKEGITTLYPQNRKVQGEIVERDQQKFYKIQYYDSMDPFFISLVGAGNHWMFISSNGALTAGRRDPQNALFPYSTDDKITDSAEITGSKTILHVTQNEADMLWEPFTRLAVKHYNLERNIYKSIYGHTLEFEEINHSLNLSFSYSWQFSNAYGFVKSAQLKNLSDTEVSVEILDGIQNIMPYGVDELMQRNYSTLVDAYKKNEFDKESGLGIYYLSSIPTDKAEPSEGLKATTVWSLGLRADKTLLSSKQLDAFRMGADLKPEDETRALRGAYFISSEINLSANQHAAWRIVAELEQDQADVFNLKLQLAKPEQLKKDLLYDLNKGAEKLLEIVAKADGLQEVKDDLVAARHFSNVLFNCMRGGIFQENYAVSRTDLKHFLEHFNKSLVKKYQEEISQLALHTNYTEVLSWAEELGDPDLIRLCTEYLPLSFGRRHGDPSRPWNRFNIRHLNDDGSARLYYEGNWRDIFQNWEALAYSYPGFTEGMIFRFLNASTADGYNPYRITRDGIDWEVIDPDDPWSNIGYWGDHQIIYLLKLLEASEKFHPGKLKYWLTQNLFAYTHVPYHQKLYAEKLKDPRNTIIYSDKDAQKLQEHTQAIGADGKLLQHAGKVYHVNLAEKLLVPVLAKLSNLVLGGGIWLNTQRPEWNDANNALVGNGLSMVTVYYLRRHLAFIEQQFLKLANKNISLSAEVSEWLQETTMCFEQNQGSIRTEITPMLRRSILDSLGESQDKYLQKIYSHGFSGKRIETHSKQLVNFIRLAIDYIDVTIEANQRADKLFHAYNLMNVESRGGIVVEHLQEMLEGQVAVLSSRYLTDNQVLEVLESLRKSSLYRADQNSYLLYPNKRLPAFLEKNRIPAKNIAGLNLVQQCLKNKDYQLVKPIGDGQFQFNGSFKNAADIQVMLKQMETRYDKGLVKEDGEKLIKLFEEHFNHHAFTGRSGTFFKYEGLGSIYWHMVSKLVLAVQENFYLAVEGNWSSDVTKKLQQFYVETKEGLGLHKNPADYGAFTTDPYSHTPLHAGVQQPGMTGQVKEDILSRWGELGIQIKKGEIHFSSALVKHDDFLEAPATFHYLSLSGKIQTLELPRGAMAFTFCQVPFVYIMSETNKLVIHYRDNSTTELEGSVLPDGASEELFKRTGIIEKIAVHLKLNEK